MGIVGSVVLLTWVLALNVFSSWMIIKARDRFKFHVVKNLSDLVYLTFGETAKKATDVLTFLV